MKKINIFLDSGALIAGVLSDNGAAHALLMFGADDSIVVVVSQLVIVETERAVSAKSLRNIEALRDIVALSKLQIMPNPSDEEIQANLYLIGDRDDVPILLAAMKAKVDYLASHDHKHFLDDPQVAKRAGFKIGTPGKVLMWVRDNLKSNDEQE